jgi:hypothetical protein
MVEKEKENVQLSLKCSLENILSFKEHHVIENAIV